MLNRAGYQCHRFTIEWYYNKNGKSPALEYFRRASPETKEKLLSLFVVLDKTGKIFDIRKFRYEGNHIFVFKVHQDRFFCFFTDDSKIIITNAYKKKYRKGSKIEMAKAIRAKQSYINRRNEGAYYDQKNKNND